MVQDKLLLHMCCGPCTIYPLKALREEGYDVHGYFFNPNIHPYQEYQRRLQALLDYAKIEELPVEVSTDYLFREFLRSVAGNEDDRCKICYTMRLSAVAKKARSEGYDGFSSTLLVSPFQQHEIIREIGEKISAEYAVPFIYRDLRPGYKSAVGRAKQLQLYRQPYCGCIYSEFDRFGKEDYNG